MSRVCAICNKRTEVGRQITRRGLAKAKGGVGRRITGKTKRQFKPNLQRVKVNIDGRTLHVRVCAQCLRSGKVSKASPRSGKEAGKEVKTA